MQGPGQTYSAINFSQLCAVEEGKHSDGGFKGEVHQWDPQSLLDSIRTFKQLQNAFVACGKASGFGWDKVRSKVTACDETVCPNEIRVVT
ncbi:hypothetical protein VP01_1728g5 [Puccinia sorghi]|uniref:Myb/SANT-like domain-containing protein n=1 Tax=Puccinia sorghi TaxID=27349 RepID=A0A0L6VFA0_9BASI|nr:hypothetical protein VP01_1728g5 [Puccinia sorghi]